MTFSSNIISHRRLGAIMAASLLAAFIAGSPRAGQAATQEAAASLSPIDRLIAESEIRNKIAKYGLLVDGDEENPRDFQAMGVEEFGPDVMVQGKKFTREQLVKQSEAETFDPNLEGRHMLLSTYFDELTPTTAKTRTSAMYLIVTKKMQGAPCSKAVPDACGGRVVYSSMWIYHHVWNKTPDGWRIVEDTELHGAPAQTRP